MKRFRGFRLGRRLVGLWRRVAGRCPRRRPTSYVRLEPDGESDHFELSWAAKFFCWGRRLLARRLRLGDAGGAGTAGGKRRMLAESPAREGEADGKGPGWRRPAPRGHLAVYVGGEGDGAPPRRRYTVPVIYFNHPLFAELLREAQEEFGFHHPGGITIPCPAAEFERVRRIIAAAAKNDHEKLRRSISAPL